MFNELFVNRDGLLIFDEHLPGKGKKKLYVYDFQKKKWRMHGKCYRGRTFQGKKKMSVNRDGKEIIIF